MRWPKWLDRERRIRAATIFAQVKARDAALWFGLYTNMSAELVLAKAERDNAREDLKTARAELASAKTEHFNEAKALQGEKAILERAARQGLITPPSTFAPSPDRENAVRLAAECADLRAQVDVERAVRADLGRHFEDLANRHNAMTDEYLRERARLIDQLAKYEGVPS